MFSGLVREIAEVKSFTHNTLEILTHIAKNTKDAVKIGDSIAINGACLTVEKITPKSIVMLLSSQTQHSIAIENYKKGQKVHLERALRLSDRLDGHIVQGHIDGIGDITRIIKHSTQSDFYIKVSPQMRPLLIPKGSICVEGISLTIVECNDNIFKLTLIPHTLQNTLFGEFRVGRRVNIESDVITRSVASTLQHILATKNAPSWEDIDRISFRF